MDSDEISAGIVAIQRKARFAGTTPEEWARRLEALIEGRAPELEAVTVTNVRPVGTAAGGSNGTMLFDINHVADGQAQTQHLVLRFLPTEGLFHRYDVSAQFNLQRALQGTKVPVPRQLWLDADGAYLERPGYVMAQVPGVSTPMAWMTSGLLFDASPAERRRISLGYIHALADIHAVDWRGLDLQWLENRAAGDRPIEREANWYWDSLLWSENADYIAMLAPVRDWLIANEPSDIDTVICHGDANYGNYLYLDGKVTAVVDWEMAFLGAPECDITFLKIGDEILLDAVPWPEGALIYDEMRAEYERYSGRPLRHVEYFELFASYRLAVINVLAMKHFPKEVLESFMPVLKRGPELCLQRAKALGAAFGD
ncbi:MAG TPA: phosphotransferase family protein [Caulobacteraceae bacterium]